MTEEQSTEERPDSRARSSAQRGFGMLPVIVGGALAAVLASVLVCGGIGAAGAMTATPVAASSHATKALPTPTPGVPTPGSDVPASPPDRASDQTAAPQPDKIYLIQDGDTLTSISARLGMSVDSIAAYNAIRNVNVIDAGAVLRVPFIYVPPAAGTSK
ncbi:LysM peptidoglycan-binding domain-containing protein [Leifsonia sp. NPDC058194]|uniref:LysM peptidoglycan-binding domain-containing protein n=1 Tax=Leifsonia sp. NPDC058194 TaxID=3346374 RepID=UPI0036D80AB3